MIHVRVSFMKPNVHCFAFSPFHFFKLLVKSWYPPTCYLISRRHLCTASLIGRPINEEATLTKPHFHFKPQFKNELKHDRQSFIVLLCHLSDLIGKEEEEIQLR